MDPHQVLEVELRRATAQRWLWSVLVALPVVLLLCTPWNAVYLAWAAGLTPFALIAWWMLRQSAADRARLLCDADAWAQHPEAFAQPGRLQDATVDADGTGVDPAPLPELAVLMGTAVQGRSLLSPLDREQIELPWANALVCHDLGVYVVDATAPRGAMRRPWAGPAHDRRAVLALAASGALWRPERVKFSSAWQGISGWSADDEHLTLWANDGTPFRWHYRVGAGDSGARREIDAQLAEVSAALTRRLGPPIPVAG